MIVSPYMLLQRSAGFCKGTEAVPGESTYILGWFVKGYSGTGDPASTQYDSPQLCANACEADYLSLLNSNLQPVDYAYRVSTE